jgi:hypothetical protein
MRRGLAALAVLMAAGDAQAAQAPKFQRMQVLSVAFEQLKEVTYRLNDRIERIEYIGGDVVRFVAGKCFVTVTVRNGSPPGATGPPGASPDLFAEVGSPQCSKG